MLVVVTHSAELARTFPRILGMVDGRLEPPDGQAGPSPTAVRPASPGTRS
jgi:hypothetical protein